MNDNDREIDNAIVRESFYFFLWKVFEILHPGQPVIDAWHVRAMCYQLHRVYLGEITRLLITVPPRHLKSITTAVAFVAWVLGKDPSRRILVASYGQDLASKHARDFKRAIDDPWYSTVFPEMRVDLRRSAAMELTTTMNGFRKGISLGGPATGFGGHMLIVDDLMKADDARSSLKRDEVKDFFEQTLFSRLDDKKTAPIIAISQRLHEDDFPGI